MKHNRELQSVKKEVRKKGLKFRHISHSVYWDSVAKSLCRTDPSGGLATLSIKALHLKIKKHFLKT